jgi:hypothetical protein
MAGQLDAPANEEPESPPFGRRLTSAPGQGDLDGIDDVRIAAAGVIAVFARMGSGRNLADGMLSDDQRDIVEAQCRNLFQVGFAEAENLAAYGCQLARQSSSVDDLLGFLAGGLQHTLNRDEKQRLLAAARHTAVALDGAPSQQHQQALGQLTRLLGQA